MNRKNTDIWLDVHIGNVRTDTKGVDIHFSHIDRRSRVSSTTSIVDLEFYRKTMHKMLDTSIDGMARDLNSDIRNYL
jgi:hypothetical protein